MAIAQPRLLTLEEFLALPETKPAREFDEGVVTRKMSPKGRHSRLEWSIPDQVNRFAVPRKLAMAFPELRTTYRGASWVPDVAVYRWERIPRAADGKVADDFLEPPDIAIEIVSPRQSISMLIRKCLRAIARGVRIALVVDPQDEIVLVFRAGRPPQALHGADRIDLDEVLPGFELTVAELFAPLQLD